MCFDLTNKDHKKLIKGKLRPKKAKEDIIVYKVISPNNYGRYRNLRDKNGKSMRWVPGYQYTELDKTNIVRDRNCSEIHGGMLHSKKTHSEALALKSCAFFQYKIVKMIIPKGTNYYENDNEYVSKSLIYPHQNEI